MEGLKLQDFLFFWFVLILVGLVLSNWFGANALLTTGSSAFISLTRTLQMRNG